MLQLLFLALNLLTSTLGQAPAPAPAEVYQRPINSDCVTTAELVQNAKSGDVNYYPESFYIQGTTATDGNNVTVTVAKDFSVQYFDNYKLVTNSLVNETYALYQCGTPAPAASSLPSGTKIFSVPLTSVAVLETVPVAFLAMLNVIDRVQSVSSYVVNPCGQKLLSCGKVAVSEIPLNQSILQTEVEPFADAVVVSSADSNAISTFAFSASQDPGPLNRAEWIKFLGLFFNLDAVATQTFSVINSSYYNTSASINKPSVLPVLAFVDLYTYPPDTAFEVSLAAYKLNLTQDAGAASPDIKKLLGINGTSLAPYDVTNSTVWFAWNATNGGFPSKAAAIAAFHSFLQGVDIVVDETYVANPTTYNLTTFLTNMNISDSANYTFLQNKAVFREDGLVGPAPSFGLDWFEGAIARPDKVLQDFARAVQPAQFQNYTPIWIRNIAEGATVNIADSKNCNQISSCSGSPTPICPFVSTCADGSIVSQQNATSSCSYLACSA